MKRRLLFLFLLVIFFTTCNKVDITKEIEHTIQPEEEKPIEVPQRKKINGKVMYANSSEGLRIRSNPGLENERIGLLQFTEKVTLLEESEGCENIDGIDGQWFLISNGNIQGWVFGGYLSEHFPDSFFSGSWFHDKVVPAGDRESGTLSIWNFMYGLFYSFNKNGNVTYGLESTSFGGKGVWSIENDIISIDITLSDDSEEWEDYMSNNYQIKVVNRNDVILKEISGYSEIRLTRNVKSLYYTIEDNDFENFLSTHSIHERYRGGATILFYTIWANDIDTIRKLIDMGCDVNAKDNNNVSPLHYACSYAKMQDNLETIKLLIENGANINAKDNRGQTPLDYINYQRTITYGEDLTEKINYLETQGAKKGRTI